MRVNDFKLGNTGDYIILTGMMALTILLLMVMPTQGAIPNLTDQSITDAVEKELLMDQAVPSSRIDVVTNDGVVTLGGTVDNILAKERAARIAGIVKGVRAVINEIVVKPPEKTTDAEIRQNVVNALLTDPATDEFGLGVSVSDNIVTLSGTVDTYKQKVLCEDVAEGVKGVKGLNDEIKLALTERRPDSEIQQEVEDILKWDALVDNNLIQVKVKDGKVTLSGTVGSLAEKVKAFEDAEVLGVKSIDASQLKIGRWARDKDLRAKKYAPKSAAEIEGALKTALRLDPRVYSFNVTPEVSPDDSGTVTLRGKVDNLKAKRAAAQDARNTVGVREVINLIKVRSAEVVSDEDIERRIKQALSWDPYLAGYDIIVDVINGKANLYGAVDSYFEKDQAEDIASRVNGVFAVNNQLEVKNEYAPYTYNPYVDEFSYGHDHYRPRPRYPTESDLRIKKRVESELWWSPFVNSADVNVKVNEGVVTLTGIVHSWSEYNAAANNAYQGGAVYVDNDLVVQP